MKEVSEFEAKLLRILRCLMHRASIEQSLALLVKSVPRPKCLSRACVELIQDTLAKGVTEWLARSGWMEARFLKNTEIVNGRLWQRHMPQSMALTFSPHSMELLIWLTSDNVAEPSTPLDVLEDSLTMGDRILFVMTFSSLRSTLGASVLAHQSGFSKHGLISLMFPDVCGLIPDFHAPDIGFWCQPETAWVLEALQSRLARRWCEIENAKRVSSNHDDVRQIGECQATVLKELYHHTGKCGRKDLCVFVMSAAHQLFQTVAVDRWYERMDLQRLRLSDRSDILRAGLAFFHGLQRLKQWTLEAQRVSFYDDDYRASQLWKSEWDRLHGDEMLLRAERIIALVDPLRTASTTA